MEPNMNEGASRAKDESNESERVTKQSQIK